MEGHYTIILHWKKKKGPPDTHKKRTDAQTTAHVREMFSVKFKGKW